MNGQFDLCTHWVRAMKDSAALGKVVVERHELGYSAHPWERNCALTSTRKWGQKLKKAWWWGEEGELCFRGSTVSFMKKLTETIKPTMKPFTDGLVNIHLVDYLWQI